MRVSSQGYDKILIGHGAGTGRQARFRSVCPSGRVSSILTRGTLTDYAEVLELVDRLR